MINTVIFDLDGTLLYTLPGLQSSVNHALTRFGYPPRSLEEISRFIGNGVRKLVERALPGGLENPDYEAVFAVFADHYAEHRNEGTVPYAGIETLLARLKADGFTLAVLSNKGHENTVPMVRHYFGSYIPFAIGKKEGVPPKPAPDALLLLLKELDKTAEECLYVGDSEVDYQTAANAGLPCALVSWGYRNREFLEQYDAAALIDEPQQLLELIRERNR